MPKKIPTSQKSRDICKKRDWRILGGEIWVPSHAARAVVAAAKKWVDNAPEDVDDEELIDSVLALNSYGPGVRQDIGGFIDILCTGEYDDGVNVLPAIIGIQTTSRNGMSARRKKMRGECYDAVRDWLASAGIIYLHGWDQPGGPGKRYRLKEEQVILDGDGLAFVDPDEPKF